MAHRYADGTFKLDLATVESNLREEVQHGKGAEVLAEMKSLQVAVYVMIGGRMLGQFAAEQPEDFYIDSRVGKLKYNKRSILQAVQVLAIYAKVLEFTKQTMPKMQRFHNCGVW